MTKGRKNWAALVSKAREEQAPSLNVAPQVAQRIAWSSTLSVSTGPTWAAVGMSIAAALMMMLTASLTGVSWDDPLGDWLSSFFMVMS